MAGMLYPAPSPQENYARNTPYLRPGVSNFQTQLAPIEEQLFQSWIKSKNIPFDPSPTSDYDMRGFYRAMQSGDPRASNAVDPNDGKMHYPDTWKTPYHETFSKESQWAMPFAPGWTDDDKLLAPNGRVVFDDRAR